MTTVADAIKNLMELDPNEEIMIQWFTKEHAEYMDEENPIPQEQWEMAVRLFDKDAPDAEAFGLQYCIDEAGERLAP
jgi:hypothetical protein